MSGAYYNEHDPGAAAWLRELIKAGHIAAGEVDERSIEDVAPNELRGFTQCHFFAGIGGWSTALRIAGWPDDLPVWTGSCPCQPFSAAGKGAGFADERHLWPAFYHLIEQCGPPVVFGEQVASPDGITWLHLVQADLEGAGYRFAADDIPAASIGAPHIRQRTWFVADAMQPGRPERRPVSGSRPIAGSGGAGELADAGSEGAGRHSGAILGAEAEGANERGRARRVADGLVVTGATSPLVNTAREQVGISGRARFDGITRGHWTAADWIPCRDGKWRPVEPGTFPLAHGLPGRVGLLRGYGNAIMPQVAAAFIEAYREVTE